MKIDLNAIDQTQFMMHPHVAYGETLYLVQPQHIGCKWNQANKHLRSSLWNEMGVLISAGMPKFTNWGENPDNFPVPKSLKDCHVVEKVDGSLLIVTKYKGQFILRTRGTVDAHKLDNGHELEIFERDYLPKLKLDGLDTVNKSYLFEWVSPEQRIILNYGDQPEWFLVGAVYHDNYTLETQEDLNRIAEACGLKRPVSYDFPSVEDLMKNVEAWKGKEGVVIYDASGQNLWKAKSLWYLNLHRMKESLASIDKVIDVWFIQGRPPYSEFEQFITSQFDWELWTQVRPDVSKICDAWKQVEQIQAGMRGFVQNTLLLLPSRREQALKVIASYGQSGRSSMVFSLLDGKSLTDDQEKKLLYQCLKS